MTLSKKFCKKIDQLILKHFFGGDKSLKTRLFTSSLEDAFLIVDKLRKMDNCCIKMQLDVPGDCWMVTINGEKYNCKTKGLCDGYKSLPLSMCLAALKSIKVELPILEKK